MPSKLNQYLAGSIFTIICLIVLGWYYYSTTKIEIPDTTSVIPAQVDVLNQTDFDSLLSGRTLPSTNATPGQEEKIDVGRQNPFEPY